MLNRWKSKYLQNGIKPIAEYPNYILQNYWKLGGKKVRNQIGSRGKNLEMWILRYNIKLKLLAACWNLFSSKHFFFGQKLDQIPRSNTYYEFVPYLLISGILSHSSLVFKVLIKPNQDQIGLSWLQMGLNFLAPDNGTNSCSYYTISSFPKIVWIDIFFLFIRIFNCFKDTFYSKYC